MMLGDAPSGTPHLDTPIGVIRECMKGGIHCTPVIWIVQHEPSLGLDERVGVHEVGCTDRSSRDNRKARSKGFQQDERARVSARGKSEEVGSAHQVGHVAAEAEKVHATGDSETVSKTRVRTAVRMPGYGEMDVRCIYESFQNQIEILDRRLDVADKETEEDIVGEIESSAISAARMKFRAVNAIDDHLDFRRGNPDG
jgi:hypothetical protein